MGWKRCFSSGYNNVTRNARPGRLKQGGKKETVVLQQLAALLRAFGGMVAAGVDGGDLVAEGVVLVGDDAAVGLQLGLQLAGVVEASGGEVAVGVAHADQDAGCEVAARKNSGMMTAT
ncbi:hypothetical protein ABC383_16825 [Noviherbaspirillum sp. 1P10PC]|uniref:hypothetical protein n=1 Tax=Noviherbaspirillum sp. 1P10PC TaxID=3132292 RepID=UPI0039A19773